MTPGATREGLEGPQPPRKPLSPPHPCDMPNEAEGFSRTHSAATSQSASHTPAALLCLLLRCAGDQGHYTGTEAVLHERMKATQLLWQVIGTVSLWVGWYGFNCGSVGGIVGQVDKVALVAINTTTGAVLGATTAVVVSYIHKRVFVLDLVLMGILSGLVSVTGGAPYMDTRYPPPPHLP